MTSLFNLLQIHMLENVIDITKLVMCILIYVYKILSSTRKINMYVFM